MKKFHYGYIFLSVSIFSSLHGLDVKKLLNPVPEQSYKAQSADTESPSVKKAVRKAKVKYLKETLTDAYAQELATRFDIPIETVKKAFAHCKRHIYKPIPDTKELIEEYAQERQKYVDKASLKGRQKRQAAKPYARSTEN